MMMTTTKTTTTITATMRVDYRYVYTNVEDSDYDDATNHCHVFDDDKANDDNNTDDCVAGHLGDVGYQHSGRREEL
jgi:hypothetical protein